VSRVHFGEHCGPRHSSSRVIADIIDPRGVNPVRQPIAHIFPPLANSDFSGLIDYSM
jgi:hypothetical protein